MVSIVPMITAVITGEQHQEHERQYHMTMIYELWDTRSGNCLGDYATEDEVLTVVRSAFEKHGTELILSLQLITSDADDDDATPLAVVTGPELIARVAPAQILHAGSSHS
jgi:hypothetical protein